jgi:hypothetical protein
VAEAHNIVTQRQWYSIKYNDIREMGGQSIFTHGRLGDILTEAYPGIPSPQNASERT